MSSTTKNTPKTDGATDKPRDEVLKAREAKKLKKQQAKKGQVQPEMSNPVIDEKPTALLLKASPVKTGSVKTPTKTQSSSVTSNQKSPQIKKEKPHDEIKKQTETLKSENSEIQSSVEKTTPAKNSPTNPVPSKMSPKVQTISDSTQNKPTNLKVEKSREEILKEREAKKLAKQKGRHQKKDVTVAQNVSQEIHSLSTGDSRQEKLLKALQKQDSDTELSEKLNHLHISENPPVNMKTNEITVVSDNKPKPTKAERRANQEAQRAAKEQQKQLNSAQKKPDMLKKSCEPKESKQLPVHLKKHTSLSPAKIIPTTTDKRDTAGKSVLRRVKLFNHLYTEKCYFNTPINSDLIHPEIIQLGIQYSNGIIVGANARCIAFLNAMKAMIQDFTTPPQKELTRELENLLKPVVGYLKQCRPLSVSMTNALRYIRGQLTHLNDDDSDDMKKETLLEAIDTYIRDQIEKAQQAISISVQEKITDGDVILTYGCSSLIKHILQAARERNVDFRVIIVHAFPRQEGQEMLKRLVSEGIECTCVLINAVGFIMPEVTKVLLGAHALMANGYVMSRVGTAQIALIAKSYNVPVLVCCETHKFSERVQTDAFVYNEIGDPDDLVLKTKNNAKDTKDPLANWENTPHLTPLNLCYDVTPPELVTAVVTEIAILPCTSVPVVLRLKPSEIGY